MGRPASLVLVSLAVSTMVLSCDSEAPRKRAEADIIHAVGVPADYEVVDEWEDGNGGGGPIVVYRVPDRGSFDLLDVGLPAGYEPVSVKRLRGYDGFVPALNSSVRWRGPELFIGPTPDGQGECYLDIAPSTNGAYVKLSADCTMVGSAPTILPAMRPSG